MFKLSVFSNGDWHEFPYSMQYLEANTWMDILAHIFSDVQFRLRPANQI